MARHLCRRCTRPTNPDIVAKLRDIYDETAMPLLDPRGVGDFRLGAIRAGSGSLGRGRQTGEIADDGLPLGRS
jgi:hypothetical protein